MVVDLRGGDRNPTFQQARCQRHWLRGDNTVYQKQGPDFVSWPTCQSSPNNRRAQAKQACTPHGASFREVLHQTASKPSVRAVSRTSFRPQLRGETFLGETAPHTTLVDFCSGPSSLLHRYLSYSHSLLLARAADSKHTRNSLGQHDP